VIVAIVIAAAAIIGGIIVVAMGRGGELSLERPELPSRADFRSSADVADYRPPAALIGYSAVATEQALALIARTIAERDAEIDWLRRRLAELQPESLADAPTGPVAGTRDGSSAGTQGDEHLPAADATWQAGATASAVANGSAAPQPVSRRVGEDE
jgi:hypothetical protein